MGLCQEAATGCHWSLASVPWLTFQSPCGVRSISTTSRPDRAFMSLSSASPMGKPMPTQPMIMGARTGTATIW